MSTRTLGYLILFATLIIAGLASTVRSLSVGELVLAAVAVVFSLAWINTPVKRRHAAKACFMPVVYKD